MKDVKGKDAMSWPKVQLYCLVSLCGPSPLAKRGLDGYAWLLDGEVLHCESL
jgi:hypothetical protein